MHSGLCTVVLEIGINCSAMLILCRNNIRVLQFISISSTVLFSSFPFMCLPCRKLYFFYYFIRCPSRLWFPDCLYINTKKTLYCSLIFTLFALVTLICQFGFILALIALQTFIYHHYMPFLACPRGFQLSLYLCGLLQFIMTFPCNFNFIAPFGRNIFSMDTKLFSELALWRKIFKPMGFIK